MHPHAQRTATVDLDLRLEHAGQGPRAQGPDEGLGEDHRVRDDRVLGHKRERRLGVPGPRQPVSVSVVVEGVPRGARARLRRGLHRQARRREAIATAVPRALEPVSAHASLDLEACDPRLQDAQGRGLVLALLQQLHLGPQGVLPWRQLGELQLEALAAVGLGRVAPQVGGDEVVQEPHHAGDAEPLAALPLPGPGIERVGLEARDPGSQRRNAHAPQLDPAGVGLVDDPVGARADARDGARRTPQEEQGEAGRLEAPLPRPGGLLHVEQGARALGVPVVAPDAALVREGPHALEAVQVVEVPAAAGVALHAEAPAEPVEAGVVSAAPGTGRPPRACVLPEVGQADGEGADPGRGHAPRAGARVAPVAEGPVPEGEVDGRVPERAPHAIRHAGAGPAGRVQTERCVLAVAQVLLSLGIGPGPAPRLHAHQGVGSELDLLEGHEGRGRAPGQGHAGLVVGPATVRGLEMGEPALHARIGGGTTALQQGVDRERRSSGPGRTLEGPVEPLPTLEPPQATLDGAVLGPLILGACAGHRDAGREQQAGPEEEAAHGMRIVHAQASPTESRGRRGLAPRPRPPARPPRRHNA